MMTAEISKGAFAGIVVAGAWCSLIKEIILLIKTCHKYIQEFWGPTCVY